MSMIGWKSDARRGDEPRQVEVPANANVPGPVSNEGVASTSKCGAAGDSSEVEIRKLYVGNINIRMSTHELKDIFGTFGPIKNVHFGRKKDGSRNTFAFVTYYEPSDAARALATSISCGIRLQGVLMSVNKASRKHQPRKLPDGKIVWQTNSKPANVANDFRPAYRTRQQTKAAQVNVEVDDSRCFIECLNDDCLMHIFSYLPRKEMVKSERVCKRWQSLCIQMWLYIKELDFSWLSNIDGFYQFGGTRPLNRNILNRFLPRCGMNLTSLDVSYRFVKVDLRALGVIAKECQNLKCLNLSYCPIGKRGFEILSTIGSTLERVVLESCGTSTKDVTLVAFLKCCSQLKSVVLSSNINLSGECLKALNGDTLEELILDNCNGLRGVHMKDTFGRFVNLKRLSMNGSMSVDPSMLDEIVKSIPNLTSLSMSQLYPKLFDSALGKLGRLTELVSLTLNQNSAVTDSVIQAITKGCKKLEHLDISGCSVHSTEYTLTDEGMVFVAELPKLTHLKMSYMAVLTDLSLQTLAEPARLRSLECRGCPTFTDLGCSRVVELSNELELFDISGCSFVSGRTLESALSAVRLRTNQLKLRLICGGTSIWACSQTDPLLEVDLVDLCVDRHRPDFVDDMYFLSDSDGFDEDDMDNFDWECQSMFLDDGDLGEWFLANINNGFYDSDDDVEEYYPF